VNKPGTTPFHVFFNLFDQGGLNTDDLIEEPVTSGSDSSLWGQDDDDKKWKNRRNKGNNNNKNNDDNQKNEGQ
jgi:hypothetical protein